ncbi:MAG TPA: Crp/Fnr family transcriptional regulator [Bacteroidales bacterium]|nr:Crp/Fnr family transcriptional regulator [Bacteroidales bacterium]
MQNLLKAIQRYVTLSETDVSVIGQLFNKKEIKITGTLLKAGDICSEFVFIERGLFMHYINNDGKEETYYFSSENDFICDYESFVNRTISNKTIVAIEESVVYSVSSDQMQRFYSKVSTGERFGRLLTEEVFTNVVKHILSIHTNYAEQHYLDFSTRYRHIQQRIPQFILHFLSVLLLSH